MKKSVFGDVLFQSRLIRSSDSGKVLCVKCQVL